MSDGEESGKPKTTTTIITEIIDTHHHYLDIGNNEFNGFLNNLVPNKADGTYTPDEYYKDVIVPLQKELGINVIATVHVECVPDDGLAEAQWIESYITKDTDICRVKGIVASCDLTQEDANEKLQALVSSCPYVKGIRWILDYDGPFQPGGTATHLGTFRHPAGKEDYLILEEFELGYKLLEQYNLSFDLQCSTKQLQSAYTLISKYPNIPVVIDHIGKPMLLLKEDTSSPNTDGNDDTAASSLELVFNSDEYNRWYTGMKQLATLPNVYVKLSMFGWAVPGWIESIRDGKQNDDDPKVALVRRLLYEIIDLYSPNRCMIGLNWWKNAILSDSDGLSMIGPTPIELVQFLITTFESKKYNNDEVQSLFVTTAKQFYRI